MMHLESWMHVRSRFFSAHYSARMGMGTLTPAFLKGISSIWRLFGQGPVKVSHTPVSDTSNLEDPVSRADPFDAYGGSTSSRSWRNGPPTVERNSGSTLDRIPSPHNLMNMVGALVWAEFAGFGEVDEGPHACAQEQVDLLRATGPHWCPGVFACYEERGC